MVRARWNGVVIAESDDTVVVDGNHCFPEDSVDRSVLVPSDTTTVCPWKGRASYYSIVVDGEVNRDAAWYYPSPSTAASKVAGRIAMYAQLLRRGRRLRPPREHTRQLGADLLIDGTGRLRRVWLPEGPDRRPSIDEVVSAARGLVTE